MNEGDRELETPQHHRWFGGGVGSAAALAFLACFALGAAAGALSGKGVLAPAVRQPIEFNHAKHVKENGLECSVCHAFFEKEAFSGLPGADVCANCHSEAQGSSPEEARLVRLIQGGAPLDWRPLFRQPPHVFYSHRRHIVVAKIECPACHGSLAESTAPPVRVARLGMRQCIECHQRRGVSTDCTVCHR